MAHLALALLGPFQATLGGKAVEGLNSAHLRALLAYLAVERAREHPRDALAALLWPERLDREALGALRHALSNLRAALGDRSSPGDRRVPVPYLLVTRTTVQFNPAGDWWLDVAEFEDLTKDLTGVGREDPAPTDLSGLTRAVQLYRDPFLHGLSVGDSPAFDEWMLFRGEEYRRTVLEMLGQLASLQAARAEYAEAARWARRQLDLEPYREQAHRQLMAALALGGERSTALAQYETCRRLLAEELGCEPEDETQALYAQIRDGGLSQPWPQPPPAPAILSAVEHASTGAGAQPAPRFVAREQELARLGTLLERALAGRGGMALIAGEAGSGKTALLDEFARRAGQAHGDLIALRGSCNAHGGAGDPYLPFREMLQTLAGDVESKRAGGTLSPEQARRAWEALPAVGAALVEHGPDLIDRFVPGEALLRRAEGFPTPPAATRWQARLREIVSRAGEGKPPVPEINLGTPAPQADLFAQVTQVLHAVSLGRPLLLAINDLQWADGGTAALLFHLGRRLAGSRILLGCACRPEALDGEEGSSGVAAVLHELCREWGDVKVDLDRADGRAFVEAYVDSEPNQLGAGFRQALYEHTGGNPLFTVELLRSLERDGKLAQDGAGQWVAAAEPDWERWPPQVEAVIAAHLAGLPDEDRALLRAASVQGEQFIAEVAAQVLGWREEVAVRRLSGPLRTRHRLVEAVSVERLASSGQRPSAGSGQRLSRYRFRHALLQWGAYGSLDAVERAWLHEATGRALEALYAPLEGGQPAGTQAQALAPTLAQHYEAAGMPLEAARHCLEAGRWAARLVACDEAIAHLERGLSLLEDLAVSRERLRLELGLWVAMVNPVLLRDSWQAPALVRALEHLAELTQHPDLEDDPQRLAALSLLALTITWSADLERGQQVGEQLLDLAHNQNCGDRQSLRLAHWALGHSAWMLGRLVAAREHLEQALALYDPDAGLPTSPVMGADPSVMDHTTLGVVQWLLGYADQGRDGFSRAVAQAEALEQPPSVAFAHLLAGVAHMLFGRDPAAAESHAAAMRGLGQARQFYGGFVDALAAQTPSAGSGQAPPKASGQAQAAEAGSAVPAMGSGVGQAAVLLLQAQMCARAGQVALGLQATDRALAWIERTGVRLLEAEVWRTRGELLMQEAGGKTQDGAERDSASCLLLPFSEAEVCFQRALEVAREQEARWFELRAAVSLARLWQAQGRGDEARDLLAGIYGWFTEGFDTVDLVEAKALLEELE